MTDLRNPETTSELPILSEAEDILASVIHAIEQEEKTAVTIEEGMHHRYQQLREDAYGAIKSDVPALLDQMHNQISLAQRTRPISLPSAEAPYFAALATEENGKKRWILIGHTPLLSKHCPHPIIDWRTAPLAKLFFQYREGDSFEIKLPGRIAKGIILHRQIVTIQRGKLVQLISPQGHFRRSPDKSWNRQQHEIDRLHGGQAQAVQGAFFGSGETGLPTPAIAALLDQTQYRILNESGDQPLLVIGQAGSGKTTVALHRLAVLHQRKPRQFDPEAMAVIVPEKGLANLTRRLLRTLSMSRVQTKTFDQWAEAQARQLITKLPIKICEETPFVVTKMKRHRAMFRAIRSYLDTLREDITKRLALRFPNLAHEVSAFSYDPNAPLADFISALYKMVSTSSTRPLPGQPARMAAFFGTELKRLENLANDRRTLLTSEKWLMPALSPVFGEKAVRELITHSQLQNGATADQKFRDVDEDRRTALDGQDLDWGTPDEISATLDVEDFPLLMELAFQKFGAVKTQRGNLPIFAHAIVDEAQEFSPTELRLLGHALSDPASVTIAGDAFQNTDTSSHFESWDRTIEDLGLGQISSHQLTTSYRCPAPIAKIAQEILGHLNTHALPTARAGLPVLCSRVDGIGQGILMIADELADLQNREPNCTIAVIAREEDTAHRLYQALSNLTDCRLVLDGEFPFRPGIDVTVTSQVKGLEFDYVIVPDADSKYYGADDNARRTLHLACTRACHQLWLVASGTPTPTIPAGYFQQS
jgi:DNA helicase II / ATP-dependent DNA helicase PcrA